MKGAASIDDLDGAISCRKNRVGTGARLQAVSLSPVTMNHPLREVEILPGLGEVGPDPQSLLLYCSTASRTRPDFTSALPRL